MRNILLVVLVAASACAPKGAAVPTIQVPAHYSCSGVAIERAGGMLLVGQDVRNRGWSDAEGDHFVKWPLATTDVDLTEYLIPADIRKDAMVRTYDTTAGTQRADWRLVKSDVCRVEGGYSDILMGFLGQSLDDLSQRYKISRDEVSSIVHDALLSAQRRYYGHR